MSYALIVPLVETFLLNLILILLLPLFLLLALRFVETFDRAELVFISFPCFQAVPTRAQWVRPDSISADYLGESFAANKAL